MKLALLQFAQIPPFLFVRIHRKERFTPGFMKNSFTFHGRTAIIRVTAGAQRAERPFGVFLFMKYMKRSTPPALLSL